MFQTRADRLISAVFRGAANEAGDGIFAHPRSMPSPFQAESWSRPSTSCRSRFSPAHCPTLSAEEPCSSRATMRMPARPSRLSSKAPDPFSGLRSRKRKILYNFQVVGGDGGIRTLDRALQPYNGLANRRLQPLGHVSALAHTGPGGRHMPERLRGGKRLLGAANKPAGASPLTGSASCAGAPRRPAAKHRFCG
jgi:hypothetical protein